MSIQLLSTMIQDPSGRLFSSQASCSDSEESCRYSKGISVACNAQKVTSIEPCATRRYEATKKVPFATGNGFEGVYERVHEFEVDDHNPKDVWWSSDELQEIRRACKKMIRRVRDTGRKADYELSLEILASSFDPVVEQHEIGVCLPHFVEFSYARALERHLAEKILLVCQEHEEEVFDAQDEIARTGYFGSARGALMLKSAAQISSRKTRHLALTLAEFDAHEAYRAILSPWEGK